VGPSITATTRVDQEKPVSNSFTTDFY